MGVLRIGEFPKSRDELQKENRQLREKLEDLSEAATKAADQMAECFKEKGAVLEPLFVREFRAAIARAKPGK